MEQHYGTSVRSLREKRGLTQRQLATAAKTSQSAIARIELGSIDPRMSTFSRIFSALDAQMLVAYNAGGVECPSYDFGEDDECTDQAGLDSIET